MPTTHTLDYKIQDNFFHANCLLIIVHNYIQCLKKCYTVTYNFKPSNDVYSKIF